MTELGDTWADLEARLGTEAVLRRLHPESAHDLFAALTTERRRQLIYRRPWGPGYELDPLPRTRAVTCRTVVRADGQELDIIMELGDDDLADVFDTVVRDLAMHIAESATAETATTALAVRLAHWLDLFQALGGEGLTRLEVRGLIGELLVLRDHLLPYLTAHAAVRGWSGPLRRNQDFQLPTLAVEVKVTTGLEPQALVVANERELDETGVGCLLLVHLSLDEREGGPGASLNELVDQISDLLTGPAARSLFRDRLVAAGYLIRDRHRYDTPVFEVRNLGVYRVGDDFPRITEADLRRGVGQVRYSVTLAACADFAIGHDDLTAHVRAQVEEQP